MAECFQDGFASSRRAHAANVLDDIGNFFRGILDRLSGKGSPIVNAANAKQAAAADGGEGPTLYYAQAANGVTGCTGTPDDGAFLTVYNLTNPGKSFLLLTNPAGIMELYLGRVVDLRVELVTDAVVRTVTAKEVNAAQRLYGIVDGALLYAHEMAAVGQPMSPHLSAKLNRVAG